MNEKEMSLVYFSPTGTTKSIIEAIAGGTGFKISEVIDITTKKYRSGKGIIVNSPVIVGAPVYGGRVQKDAIEFISTLKGNNSPAVVVAVYGNRAYDDALVELFDTVSKGGFVPIAAAAFIGEHSFSSTQYPIAAGRPDENDLEQARGFGKTLAEKLNECSANFGPIELPGNRPYKERGSFPLYDAIVVSQNCTLCKACVDVCPMEALSTGDAIRCDVSQCIFCCACVKACPVGARSLNDGIIKDAAKRLSDACLERKEPQIFV